VRLIGLCNAPGGNAWMQIIDEETRVRVVQLGIVDDGACLGLVQVNKIMKNPDKPELEHVIQRIGGWVPIRPDTGLPDWDVPIRWAL
jgi:hypothetical protein